MSDLYIEARLQAIKDIASASCVDIKDADNIASFCDEIYSAIPNIDRIVEELEKQRDIIFQNTDSEIRTVRASAWDNIDILNKAIEIVKQGSVRKDVE